MNPLQEKDLHDAQEFFGKVEAYDPNDVTSLPETRYFNDTQSFAQSADDFRLQGYPVLDEEITSADYLQAVEENSIQLSHAKDKEELHKNIAALAALHPNIPQNVLSKLAVQGDGMRLITQKQFKTLGLKINKGAKPAFVIDDMKFFDLKDTNISKEIYQQLLSTIAPIAAPNASVQPQTQQAAPASIPYNAENYLRDLKAMAQHTNLTPEASAQLYKKNPKAEYMATTAEFEKMGYPVKKSEIDKGQQLDHFAKDAGIYKDDRFAPLDTLNNSERLAVMNGTVQLEYRDIVQTDILYDIAQTSFPPQQAEKFSLPIDASEHGSLLESMKTLSEESQILVTEMKTDAFAMWGHFDKDNNTIYLNPNVDESKQLSGLVQGYCQALTASTSDRPDTQKAFEQDSLYKVLCEKFHLPESDNLQSNLASEFSQMSPQEMQNSRFAVQKRAHYIDTNVSQLRGQAPQVEKSQTQEQHTLQEISTNFTHEL